MSLKINFLGREFINPIIPASGTFGFGYEFKDLYGFTTLSLGMSGDYPIAIKGLVVRGVYFVRIVSGTGEVHVGRLVVR